MISDALRIDIEKWASTKDTRPLIVMAKSGRLTRAMVTRYIANITYMIHYTPIHLRLALDASRARGDEGLVGYFEHKIEEEDGHEVWGHEDLETLERVPVAPVAKSVTPAIRALAEHVPTLIAADPAFYLAYIAFVEYITVLVGPELLADIEGQCGVARTAMTVVDKHIELDKAHVEENFGVIDDLVPDPRKLSPMRNALAGVLVYFERFCEEVVEEVVEDTSSREHELANVSAA